MPLPAMVCRVRQGVCLNRCALEVNYANSKKGLQEQQHALCPCSMCRPLTWKN